MSVTSLDQKSRVVLEKKIREVSGLKKGSRVVAIPFKGGVTLVDVTGRKFVARMSGFGFKESDHEASKVLFGRVGKKKIRRVRDSES